MAELMVEKGKQMIRSYKVCEIKAKGRRKKELLLPEEQKGH